MFYLPPLSKNLKNENVTCCSIWFLNSFSLLREEHTECIWEKDAERHTFGWSYSKYQMDEQNQVRSSIIILTLDEGPSRSRWPQGQRCASAAADVVGLRGRIPLEARMSFSCECCFVSQRSLRRANPLSRGVQTSVCACVCAFVCHCMWLGATITVYA